MDMALQVWGYQTSARSSVNTLLIQSYTCHKLKVDFLKYHYIPLQSKFASKIWHRYKWQTIKGINYGNGWKAYNYTYAYHFLFCVFPFVRKACGIICYFHKKITIDFLLDIIVVSSTDIFMTIPCWTLYWPFRSPWWSSCINKQRQYSD